MAKVRVNSEQLYYELDIRESPTNPDFFNIIVEAFVRDPRSRGPGNVTLSQAGDPVLMNGGLKQELISILAQESEFKINLAEFSNVVSQSGNGTHKYHYKFVSQYPFDFVEGPPLSVGEMFGNSVLFTWPRTLELDITSFSQNQDRISEKVRNAAEAQGISIPATVEIHQDTTSYSDVYIDSGRIAYIPFPFLLSEQLEAERDALIGEQGQSKEPALEDAEDKALQKKRADNNANLNEQAVLLFRIAQIMSVNKERREKSKLYDRFVCLDYKKNGKADAANISNHITSTTDLKDVFEDLRPIHLSAMIPKVRLFKQYTPDEMKNRTDGEPREIVEYQFEEFPDASILNQSLGTSTGVGISSFSWEFNGENQYSSEKMVSAKMQLRAQSIDALNAKRRSPKQVEYRFCDIFYPPSVRKQDRDSKQLQVAKASRKKYEAKVVVEYGVEANSDVWEGSQELLKAIQTLRLEMSLSMFKYDLDLQPDGSILLNLDFIGRIDASSNDPFYANILPKSSMIKRLGDATTITSTRNANLQTIAELENKIKLQKDEAKPLEETRAAAALDMNKTGLSDEQFAKLKEANKNISLLSKDLTELQSTFKPNMTEKDYLEAISREYDKIKLYQNIINGLFQRDAIDVLQLDPKDILSEEKTRIIQNEQSLTLSAVGEKPTTADIVNADLSTSEFDQSKKAFMQRMKASIFAMYNNDEYYIRYFYFGDLLNVVLDNMLGESENFQTDIRTLLGPIEIVQNAISSDTFASRLSFGTDGKIALVDSYGTQDVQIEKQFLEEQRLQIEQLAKAQRAGDVKQIKEAEQDRQVSSVLVNLADVPISLNLFLQWFSEKIANQGTYSYSLKKFTTDCINSLIISALQADSTKLILPKQKRKLVITSFDAVADVATPDVFGFFHSDTDGLITNRKNSAMFVEDFLTNTAGKQSLPLFLSKNRPMSPDRFMADYMLVYAESTDYFRIFRTNADYKRDLKEGIYHLHSGKDAGVVKEIKLSAETVPGYEEMMMIEAMKGGEPSIKRIYSANVTLNGVPVFRPGHKVFIKAAAYGTDELLREFGLMGYYSVVRTSSNISAGQYETTLELVYQGSG